MANDPVHLHRTLTVGADPDAVFARWREPDVFRQVMAHVADVDADAGGLATWVRRGPDGTDLRWQTQVTEADERAHRLRWQTIEGEVDATGELTVAGAGDHLGSEVRLDLTLGPDDGPIARAVATAAQPVAGAAAATALRRFKSLVETGEIPTLERNPSAADDHDQN